ncbi:MAG: hypothetical protein LRY53_01190 [Burkholderiaceae bacterium]|nr:hypothetical protein [Burkholderiaceae bacterium]MCD8564292.1 hypothetical protein [Burkholderiaceae bacterium]
MSHADSATNFSLTDRFVYMQMPDSDERAVASAFQRSLADIELTSL